MGTHDALRRHFREALAADPVGAYRDWFRTQEELRERGDGDTARVLADDLWELLPVLGLEPMQVDAGLLLDFLCCVLVYAAIRLGSRHARRWSARRGAR